MIFEIMGKDECFYYLKGFENEYVGGVYKIYKYHFNCVVENIGQYFIKLEEYLGNSYEFLLKQGILIEIVKMELL